MRSRWRDGGIETSGRHQRPHCLGSLADGLTASGGSSSDDPAGTVKPAAGPQATGSHRRQRHGVSRLDGRASASVATWSVSGSACRQKVSPERRDSHRRQVHKRQADWADPPDSCGAEAGAKASIDADPTHHRRRAPPPLPWRPYCRIAGWSPTPNTGLSSGKKNPAKPRSVAAENGPPAALPSPNRWLFHGLFPATGVRDNIRGVAFDQNSCQSLTVVVRRGHRRVSKLSSGRTR